MVSLTAGTGLPLICALKCEVAKMYNPQLRLAVENCMPSCVLNIVKKKTCVCMHIRAHECTSACQLLCVPCYTGSFKILRS